MWNAIPGYLWLLKDRTHLKDSGIIEFAQKNDFLKTAISCSILMLFGNRKMLLCGQHPGYDTLKLLCHSLFICCSTTLILAWKARSSWGSFVWRVPPLQPSKSESKVHSGKTVARFLRLELARVDQHPA